jgi:hypothetical protein
MGAPAALTAGPVADAFAALADAVTDVMPVVEMQDCTARILDQVERNLGPKPEPAQA